MIAVRCAREHGVAAESFGETRMLTSFFFGPTRWFFIDCQTAGHDETRTRSDRPIPATRRSPRSPSTFLAIKRHRLAKASMLSADASDQILDTIRFQDNSICAGDGAGENCATNVYTTGVEERRAGKTPCSFMKS